MTGYAVATSEGAAGTLTIEIKSVNSRFLDLQFRINDDLRALEPDLRAAIMGAITRGKCEARLSFGRKVAGGAQVLNAVVLADLARLQTEVARHFVSAPLLTVAELLRWPGVIRDVKFGSHDPGTGKTLPVDFELKPQVAELFEYVRDVDAGEIRCLEVKSGLPFSMEIEMAGRRSNG